MGTVKIGSTSFTFLALNFALYFRFLGLVRSLYPQHGHQSPSHFMKISQIWQRFWPLTYLPEPTGFWALWRIHIPLQVIYFTMIFYLSGYLNINNNCLWLSIPIFNTYFSICNWILNSIMQILWPSSAIIESHREKIKLSEGLPKYTSFSWIILNQR